MHDHAHDQPHDQVQQGDQQARNRIAFHEFRCTVQRAKERSFLLFTLAPFLGLLVVNGTRRHVAVDGKLLARHPVQRKPRADFGHARGAFGDHHEVDDQQYPEHHKPQKDAAAHHKAGEPFDHVPRRVRARVPPGR